MSEDDNKKAMTDAWQEAFVNNDVLIPVGRIVICDSCNEDWTDRKESGGLLFGGNAICPNCEPKWRADIAKFHEEDHILGSCPEITSFGDWVREMRGPDAGIKVRVGRDALKEIFE